MRRFVVSLPKRQREVQNLNLYLRLKTVPFLNKIYLMILWGQFLSRGNPWPNQNRYKELNLSSKPTIYSIKVLMYKWITNSLVSLVSEYSIIYPWEGLTRLSPCLPAALPLCGVASGPRAAASSGPLLGPLRFHQRPLPQAVCWHGVGHGWGSGQHHPGAAAARIVGQHGLGVLHRYSWMAERLVKCRQKQTILT